MPLDPVAKDRIRSKAAEAGYDADEAVAEAEAIIARRESAKPQSQTSASAAPKFFQWHTPFIRVRELRASLGLTEPLPDDDQTCSEYMATHGIAPAPTAPGVSQ